MAQENHLARVRELLNGGRAGEALAVLEGQPLSRSAGPAYVLSLQALVTLGRRAEARSLLERAQRLPPDDADTLDALAFFARELDQHELSNLLYRRLTELAPNDAQFWYNFATSERSLGRLAAAAAACEHALRLDPGYRAAVLLRTEVTRATADNNNVDDLRTRLKLAQEDGAAMFLWYALGKELHELGACDEAFDAFSRGAAARRRNLRYDVTEDERKLRRIEEAYGAAAPVPEGAPPSRHIFIIGLPRSGTTLAERILGGLPGVRSNNETNNLSTALLQSTPPGQADIFARSAQADFTTVANTYEALASGGDPEGSIIEKLPFNYLYLGALFQALPTARVVWLRRQPVDSCFAMFRTLFASAYPFSYDFEELARYYAAYDRLMRHWQSLFGDRILSVDYEALVAGPEDVGARMAAYCGLDWSSAALDLASNRSASLTASAAQVRGVIYATSSGIWRAYHNHLQPLAARLHSLGVATGVD